jgi:hypothetical protein
VIRAESHLRDDRVLLFPADVATLLFDVNELRLERRSLGAVTERAVLSSTKCVDLPLVCPPLANDTSVVWPSGNPHQLLVGVCFCRIVPVQVDLCRRVPIDIRSMPKDSHEPAPPRESAIVHRDNCTVLEAASHHPRSAVAWNLNQQGIEHVALFAGTNTELVVTVETPVTRKKEEEMTGASQNGNP